MYVGTDIVGICFDVIRPEHRDYVKEKVRQHHEVIELSPEQIEEFCGNAIEAKNINDELFLIMSTRAFKALDQKQIKKTSYKLQRNNSFRHSNYRKIWEAVQRDVC